MFVNPVKCSLKTKSAMALRRGDELNVLGFFGALLKRRDWVYVLSLLVPLVAYDLALKAYAVSSLPGERGLSRTLALMRSDAFFDLGYALLWIGLSAWVLLAAALFYVVLGPFFVTRAVERRLGRPGRRYLAPRFRIPVFLGPLGLLLLALLFGSLSLLVRSDPADANTSFARAPFVNVVWTGVEEVTAEEVSPDADAADSVSAAAA